MQSSQNGDVQLSVTLDTKGIKSDTQKIKDEIEKSIKSDKVKFSPKIDDKEIEKEFDKINKSDKFKIKITPEIDQNKVSQVNKMLKDTLGIDEANGWQVSINSIREYLSAYLQLSNEEQAVHAKWISDNIELIRSNENASNSVRAITDAINALKSTPTQLEPEISIDADKVTETLNETNTTVNAEVVVDPNAVDEALNEAGGTIQPNVFIDPQTIGEALDESRPVLSFNERDSISIDGGAIQSQLDRLTFTLNVDRVNVKGDTENILNPAIEKAKELKTQLLQMENAGKTGTRAYQNMLNDLIEIMGQFSREESEAYGRWEIDATMANKHAQETVQTTEEIVQAVNNETQAEQQVNEATQQVNTNVSQTAEAVNEATNATENLNQNLNESAQEAGRLVDEIEQVDYPEQESESFMEGLHRAREQARQLGQDLSMLQQGYHYSDEFVRMSNDVDTMEKDLRRTNEQLHKMEMLGEEGTSQYDRLVQRAYNLEEALGTARSALEDIRNTGDAFRFGADEGQLQRVQAQYDAIVNKIALMNQQIRIGNEAWQQMRPNERIFTFVRQLGTGLNNIRQTIISGVTGAFNTLGRTIGNVTRQIAKMGINALTASFKRLVPQLNRTHRGFGLNLRSILAMTLGVGSLMAVFGKLRSAISEGIKNLAQWNNGNNDTNKSISMLMSSLAQLKNALATAFAPILTIIAPALNYLINLLIQAANAVAQFFAVIAGQSTWKRATKQQQDYAKSLNKTGSEAKKTQGRLAAFDDLNVLGKDDDNSGGAGGGLDPNKMFEEVPIDPWFEELWKKLKEMWENADFTELGAALGQKLKEALDSIDWDAVKDFARRLASSIATFLNGFFETEGLGTSIGHTLGEAINTAFEFLYTFVTTLHWDSIGKFVGEALTETFHTIDWNLIGSTLANGLNGLLTLITEAVKTTDWHSLSEGVAEGLQTMFNDIDFSTWTGTLSALIIGFTDLICGALDGIDWVSLPTDIWNGLVELFEGIDWDGLGDAISRLLYSAVKAACDLLVGLAELGVLLGDALRESWESTKEYFAEWTDVAGGDVIKGILLGIVNALAQIGTWVQEHIFQPIIQAFEDAFGISSPSTVMEEQGGFIMEGLFNGITNMIDSVVQLWEDLKTKIMEKVELLKSNLQEKWTNIKTKANEIWTNIKTDITDKVTGLKDKVYEIVSGLRDKIIEKWNNLKRGTSEIFTELKETVIKIWDAMKEAIKKPLNAIIGGIEFFVNAIIDGINKLIEFLNGLHIDIPSWVPDIGGQTLGFAIEPLNNVEIPRLAQGAVIPPNKEFIAMLGDQRQGMNIEAPLDTIRDAFQDVVSNMQVQNTGYAQMELDGETFARLIVPYVISELDREGYNLSVIGV